MLDLLASMWATLIAWPAWVHLALIIWVVLAVLWPRWRNPDTNPIILLVVKVLAICIIVAVTVWRVRRIR